MNRPDRRPTRLSFSALLSASLLVVLLLDASTPPEARAFGGEGDENEALRTSGDIIQVAMPVLGGLSTFLTNPESGKLWDKQGTKQFAFTYGASWGTTYVLKFLASKQRPNGENRTSFPSGHTMSAFAGAAFIDGRYGWAWGVPSYALALLTGYSRVASSWHFADDVVAGASISMLYSWHFVTPQPGKFSFLPTVQGDAIGFALQYNGGAEEAKTAWDEEPRGTGYHFAFGPAFAVSNRVRSIRDQGTEFQLTDLEGNNDPTTTASATVTIPFGSTQRHELLINYAPFEAIDQGVLAYDVRFGGRDFAAGSELRSAWRLHELRAQYEYDVLRASRWNLEIGAGAGFQDGYMALKHEGEDDAQAAVVEDHGFYPYAHLAVEYSFSPRWRAAMESEALIIGGEYIFSGMADLSYRLSRSWSVTLLYLRFSRLIDTSEIYNDTKYDVFNLVMSRYW